MNLMEQSTARTAKVMTDFSRIFQGAIAYLGVREITSMADSMQLLYDRIKIFEGADQATATFGKLAELANYTKTSIDSLAGTYSRLALATKDLGVPTDALLGLTTALQQSFRLSGSTIAESSAALIQLSQGLSSGQLRGQELRSVLEQNAVIGEILAKRFNITRGQLIKFAEAGKITSKEVLQALAENFDRINNEASKMGQTFEQTVVIAMNKLKVAIGELNREWDISGKFAKAVDLTINNLGVLGAIIAGLAATQIPALVVSLRTLYTTMLANPWTAIFTGLAAVVGYAFVETEKFVNYFTLAWDVVAKSLYSGLASISKGLADLLGPVSDSLAQGFRKNAETYAKYAEKAALSARTTSRDIVDAQMKMSKGIDVSNIGNSLKTFAANMKDVRTEVDSLDKQIGRLNLLYLGGAISTTEYNTKLLKLEWARLNEEMAKSGKSISDMQLAWERIQFEALVREYRDGTVTLEAYNDALRQLQKATLENRFKEGKISVQEYHRALMGVISDSEVWGQKTNIAVAGISDYVQQAGTLAQNISQGITGVFNRLEDSLVEFTKTGKFEFRQFAMAILEDLNRIIIRQLIIKQLAGAAIGAIGTGNSGATDTRVSGGGGGNFDTLSAHGHAFNSRGQITAFATGGVVSSPTLFKYGSGKTGLMGEAGPEAILPLRRDSSGDLGVKASPSVVNVNIVNNTGAEITQRETTNSNGDKTLEILIQNKVKEGFANGAYDKTMSSVFGLQRKGF